MENDSYNPPNESEADHFHTLTRAGISSIPIVGGAGVELFGMLIQPSLERRKQAWMMAIAKGLDDLETKYGSIVDDLKSNEVFIDIVLKAAQTAVRTSQKEKLEALKNATLNSALPIAPEETLQHMFLNWVDLLSPLHIQVLRFFAEKHHRVDRTPSTSHYGGFEPYSGEIDTHLERLLKEHPELGSRVQIIELITQELHRLGLIFLQNIHSKPPIMNEHYIAPAQEIAVRFLAYISNPVEAAT